MIDLIKALFFDLDGTLLNSKRELSQQTRSTLERCKQSGIKLFIATARPPLLDQMLSWDQSTLALFDGGVYYNGGCVEIDGQKEYQFISDTVVRKAIDSVCGYDALNIALQLEGERHGFRFPLDTKDHPRWGITADTASLLHQIEALQAVKMLIFYENLIDTAMTLEDALVAALKELCRDTAQFYLTDQGRCIQIMGRAVNKVKGIEKIRESLGLGKDELAVFGDDVNDMEMLSEYPYSFAMGNAESRVKDTANYVTYDHDRDGIHHAIQNMLRLL